ncbi:MAG TPA: hypothetical protein VGM62_06395 [Chthoniobacterales bacterium]
MPGRAAILRILVTVLLVASWNLATIHCAFTAAAMAASENVVLEKDADECPMHASKPAPHPSPAKNNRCGELPCCKTLPATATIAAFACKPNVSFNTQDLFETSADGPNTFVLHPNTCRALDTGPPGRHSFTELVLRRSIPAHGPPFA